MTMDHPTDRHKVGHYLLLKALLAASLKLFFDYFGEDFLIILVRQINKISTFWTHYFNHQKKKTVK
jgi:hypothetical protein